MKVGDLDEHPPGGSSGHHLEPTSNGRKGGDVTGQQIAVVRPRNHDATGRTCHVHPSADGRRLSPIRGVPTIVEREVEVQLPRLGVVSTDGVLTRDRQWTRPLQAESVAFG